MPRASVNSEHLKLLGVATVAVAGNAVPMLVEQMTGQSLVGYGTLGVALTGLIGVAGNVIGGYLGNRVTADVDESKQKDGLLQNADWLKLTALAAASLIRKHAKEQTHYAKQLNALADHVEAEWTRLADTTEFSAAIQTLDRHGAIKYFHASAQLDPAQRRALDVETWKLILRAAAGRKRFLLTKDDPARDEDRLTRLARVLHEQFPGAVYQLLKNPAVGGKACIGLVLTMLGETHEAVCKALPNLKGQNAEIRTDVQKWGQRLLAEFTALRSRLKESNHRFDHYFRDQEEHWQVAYEQFIAIYQQGDQILQQGERIESSLQALHHKVTPAPVPGRPPRISNLHRIISERRLFVGREEILASLYAALKTDHPAAITQTQAIHAAGGVGKTQLALEYAERHADEYDLIWWVRAETRETVVTDLSDLAVPLQLISAGQAVPDQDQLVAAVLGLLRQRERWLLIYDNAETPADLAHLMPGGRGHLLLTSRNPNWGELAHPFPLGLLSLDDAMDLLRQRSGMADPVAEEQIALRLGRLPLALAVAGSYCAATGMPLAEYLPLLEESGLQLLDQHQPVDYNAVLTKTWLPSIAKACEECPDAAQILNLLAFLSPENFPLRLLEEPLGGQLKLNAAVAALRKFSLVERNADQISIQHRLLQDVLHDQLGDEDRERQLAAAVKLLDDAIPNGTETEPKTWPICEELLPHGLAVVSHVRDGAPNPPRSVSRLFNQMAGYQYARAQYRSAIELLQRSLAIDEQLHGPDHPKVAIRINNLALLLKATNRLAEAEPLMRRALAIDEQSYGPDHPVVAIRLNNLAALLLATNHLAEAELLMRRALAINEQSYGPDHPNVAICLNNLATLLQDTDRLAEAEPLMRRVVTIFENSLGENHPNVGTALNNLAQLLQATNRLAEAEPLMRRALAIDEQSYGPDHPHVAIDLNNLAQLLQATNRLAEAEPLMRRALAIDEKNYADQSYGPDHPYVATRLNNLAQLLQATNRLAEAEPLMRLALAIDEQSYGPDHPNVAIRINNLAFLLQDTNHLAEAEPLFLRQIVIDALFQIRTGHQHPDLEEDTEKYRTVCQLRNVPEEEIQRQITAALETRTPPPPIVPEIERLLGPAKPVAEVLAELDRQSRAAGPPENDATP